MKIGTAIAFFAASVATSVYGMSVAQKHDAVSLLSEKFIAPNAQVIEEAQSYILQGNSIEDIQAKLGEVGAQASQSFPIINAVSASLTPSQVSAVKASGSFRVQADRTVMTMKRHMMSLQASFITSIDNHIAQITNVSRVHDVLGQTGSTDIGVMFVDSGFDFVDRRNRHLMQDLQGNGKVSAPFNAMTDMQDMDAYLDENGHGTHVAGIVSSTILSNGGNYNGIAPDVKMLSVKAFDENGSGSYSTVLNALNWIYENADLDTFRVLNLSIGAPVASHYWQDPINQAVMRLWDEGVVVVTSAGNSGEELGISVPGNNPYVITVGAMADNGTPTDFNDDRIATFSSRGPTYEGFVKPDLVAPGMSIAVQMGNDGKMAQGLRQHEINDRYYVMSGTSQASAVVSGIAALILSQHPDLSADDVKCRIVSTARTAVNNDMLSFSPFAQGSGLVDAYAAVTSIATGCANVGLDIEEDLEGDRHFYGPVQRDEKGEFYIELANGEMLTEGSHWGRGFSVEGSHWGSVFSVEGSHWGDNVSVEGALWGNNM
ncbi:MAG: S8 family peptidase [Pseudomonadota bacterium]